MLRPAPGQLPVAEVCRRRTRASLQSSGRLSEALITHCRRSRQRLPRSTAAVGRQPPSACGIASRTDPASSGARLSACRKPRGSARSLRNRLLLDLPRPGCDAADAVVLVPRRAPSYFSTRPAHFIDGFALTLTVKNGYTVLGGRAESLSWHHAFWRA